MIIEGATFLTEGTTYTTTGILWMFLWLVGLIIALVMGLYFLTDSDYWKGVACLVVAVVLFYLLPLIPKQKEYAVFLNDGTNYSEFCDRYRVRRVNGKILYITEKEESK